MSFFALLVALLLDLVLRQFEHLRGPRWFRAYFESLAFLAQAANFWRAGFGVLVVVLVPTVVTLFVGHLLDQIWAGLGFAFAVLILLLTLGSQDLHAQATDYIEAVRAGNRSEER